MSVPNLPSTLSVLRPVAFSGPDAAQAEEALPNHSTETETDAHTVSTHSDGHTIDIPPMHERTLHEATTNSPHQSPRNPTGTPKTPKTFPPSPAAATSVLPQRPEPAAANLDAGEPGGSDDEVNDIELGIEDLSSEDETGVVGFSAAEIAGRAMGGRHNHTYEARLGLPTRHDAMVEQRGRADSEVEEKNQLGRTPQSSTRRVLLDNLPDSTIPPDSRVKMQTFAQLKIQLRWWTRLMLTLSGAITILGIVDIAIAATAIPTAFLYPSFPYTTLVLGIIMLPLGPASAFLVLRYQADQLRIAYLGCFAAFAYALIAGIIVATKQPSTIDSDVQSHWVYDRSSPVASQDGMYSASRQNQWDNDESKLIDQARSNLANMTIVLLTSAAIAALQAVVTWRTCNRLQKHFHLTALQTESKSATVATRARRQQEIRDYKHAMETDTELARVVDEERIPDEVKIRQQLSASKYFEAGAGGPGGVPTAAAATGLGSTKSKSRRLHTDHPGRPASAKSHAHKQPRDSGSGLVTLGGVALAAGSTRGGHPPAAAAPAAKKSKRATTAATAAAAGASEKAEKKRRKKEKREAPKEREEIQLGIQPLQRLANLNVVDDQSESEDEEKFTAVKL